MSRPEEGVLMSTENSTPDPMRLAQPLVIDERIKRMIAGAVAEIDPAQIKLSRSLTPAQRFAQMMSMIKFTESIAVHRLRLREPEVSETEAVRIVRSGEMIKRVLEQKSVKTRSKVYVHSPEDLILNKVRYFGLSQQTKHVRDIASMIVFMGDQLDWAYIEEWAQKLNLTAAWYELLGEVDKLLGTAQ